MTVRGYLLGVDWANVGDPASPGVDETSAVKSDEIQVGWGRDTTQAGSALSAGTLVFVLDDSARRYSPTNLASPLNGLVLPGRRVVLQHTDATPATVTLFDGVLDTPAWDPGTREFTASCADAWGRPSGGQLSTAVYRGLRTGDAVNLVLDAIGWRGGRAVDPGSTIMPWWWEEGTDAATAIEKLVNSEGPPALAYVAGGVFCFEDRFHRLLTPASTTSAGTFTNTRPGGAVVGGYAMAAGSITYDHGLRGIVNAVTFNVDQREPADAAEVWSSDRPIVVPANTPVPVFVSTTDPVIMAVTPAEGAGIDSSSSSVTAVLSRDSGAGIVITLTAPVDTVVNRLALTATPVPVARTVQVAATDNSSVGIYGRNGWPSERSPVWANVYDAQDIADRIVATYATNRPVMSFEVANIDDTYMAQIRNRRISDRITIRDDVLGVNQDFVVEKVGHTIRKWGRSHRAQFTCEVPLPQQSTTVFTFNTTGRGFNDGRFGVRGIPTGTNLFMFNAGFDTSQLAVVDTFTRTVSAGFGSTDLGQPYTFAGGVGTDYNVAAGQATVLLGSVNVARNMTLSGVSLTDTDSRVTFTVPAVATGAPLRAYLYARFADTSNWYTFEAAFETDGSITAVIVRRLTGSDTTLVSGTVVAAGGYIAASRWTVAGAVFGSHLSIKIWAAGGAEPDWQLQATDTTFASGSPGVRFLAATGNTNTTPTFGVDDLLVSTGGHGFGSGVFGA